jgi:hypothetical protein
MTEYELDETCMGKMKSWSENLMGRDFCTPKRRWKANIYIYIYIFITNCNWAYARIL